MSQKVIIAFNAEPTEKEMELAKKFTADLKEIGVEYEYVGSRPKDRE